MYIYCIDLASLIMPLKTDAGKNIPFTILMNGQRTDLKRTLAQLARVTL